MPTVSLGSLVGSISSVGGALSQAFTVPSAGSYQFQFTQSQANSPPKQSSYRLTLSGGVYGGEQIWAFTPAQVSKVDSTIPIGLVTSTTYTVTLTGARIHPQDEGSNVITISAASAVA